MRVAVVRQKGFKRRVFGSVAVAQEHDALEVGRAVLGAAGVDPSPQHARR